MHRDESSTVAAKSQDGKWREGGGRERLSRQQRVNILDTVVLRIRCHTADMKSEVWMLSV